MPLEDLEGLFEVLWCVGVTSREGSEFELYTDSWEPVLVPRFWPAEEPKKGSTTFLPMAFICVKADGDEGPTVFFLGVAITSLSFAITEAKLSLQTTQKQSKGNQLLTGEVMESSGFLDLWQKPTKIFNPVSLQPGCKKRPWSTTKQG
jgi:hypothetical protein